MYNARMSNFPEIQTLENKLRLEREKLLSVCKTLSDEKLLHIPEDGWSVKDILAHVANSEALNVKFARLMLELDKPKQVEVVRGDYPDYVGDFDLDRFNAYMTGKLRKQSLDVVRQALEETRAATYAWLDTLTPEMLDRQGEHAAWGPLTVRGMVKILMLHDKTHTQEIVKRAGQL